MVVGFDGVGYVSIDNEQPRIGVRATFGTEPGCEHQTIRLAEPRLACSALEHRMNNAYVFVPSSAGCPVYEKALHVQNAGGKGLIFAGESGQQPFRVDLEVEDDIEIPVIMIHYSSGRYLREQLTNNKHRHVVTQARFLFTIACLENEGFVDQEQVDQWLEHHQPYDVMKSGLLTLQETPEDAFEVRMAHTRLLVF